MAAASGGKGNDRFDALRIGAGHGERAPAARGMADDDRAVVANEGLFANVSHRCGDTIRRGAAGAEIVGIVAAALVFQVASVGDAMAGTFSD